MDKPAVVEVEVKKGQTVDLPGGVKLTFVAHGHKRTMTGGPPSPLIVYVSYERDGKREEKQHNVHPERDGAFWSWGGLSFEILDHKYGDYMKLRVREEKPGSMEITIKKGESVELLDGVKLTFVRHSHKMQMAGGPESPLIIVAIYERGGKRSDEISHQVYPGDEHAKWSWGGYEFLLLADEYDKEMKFRVSREVSTRH